MCYVGAKFIIITLIIIIIIDKIRPARTPQVFFYFGANIMISNFRKNEASAYVAGVYSFLQICSFGVLVIIIIIEKMRPARTPKAFFFSFRYVISEWGSLF